MGKLVALQHGQLSLKHDALSCWLLFGKPFPLPCRSHQRYQRCAPTLK